MIKFISQKPRIEKDNILINQIKGYSDVKNDLCKHLKLLQYSAEHKNAQVISGFALIGKKNHGRHYMVDLFLEASDKKAFVIDGSFTSNTMGELRNFLDRVGRDEAIIVQLDNLDQMKEEQIDIIAGLLRESGNSYIFVRDGERITARQIAYILEKYAARSGNPVKSTHKMRKTFASRAAVGRNGEPGISLDAVREILGHNDLKTTLGYIYNPDTEKETYEKLKAVL